MAQEPETALSVIRNKLQVILAQAELRQNSNQCNSCTVAVFDIVNELRALEAFVVEASRERRT
ncbi:MAG TPA: hypothetical protein VEI52_07895 [Terriglobales bacterium]|nr:hypothetical protein [Terriglobales bacterium]